MHAAEELTELLARVALQDRASFEALYQRTSDKLLGIILRILARRELAEEILQEVYVKIWQNADRFDRSRASAMTWMSAIARNRAIDELRRKSTLAIVDLPEGIDSVGDKSDPLAPREHSEQLRALLACLEQLDAQKRLMVLLAYYRGASREALSQRFDTPVATVKTWLHRSLAQLRRCLS